MKIKGVFLAAILTAVLCISGNLLAYSGDGDGTTESPYQISIVEDWQELMATPDDWSSSFILTADVNLAGVTLTPVGNDSSIFTGVFDGAGHVILNAVINQPSSDYVGLFGYVMSGQIKNLGVEDPNIIGREYVGGLVGYNYGQITSCYATGTVSGSWGVGGLVGLNLGAITSSYATGAVSGGTLGGGLVGWHWGTIMFCYATGAVSGGNCGGLVGISYIGTITSSYATGAVSGGTCGGGLVGRNFCSVTSCYATGAVSGNSEVGGLVGGNYNNGTLTDCFWDIQTSGQSVGVAVGTSTGVTGKTTAEMKQINTFANWDFAETWGIEDNQTYPFLKLTYPIGDINCDKVVNFLDFAILASRWLEGI